MNSAPKKLRWPRALYETRPAACLSLGALLIVTAFVIALRAGFWPVSVTALLVVGIVLILYGGITRQLRGDYRRHHPGASEGD